MKLKLNEQGFAVVRDGKPVYILDNGTEQGIDGAAAMKLALGKYFEVSPVMAGLNIPHDVAAAFFGDSFVIEGGKMLAIDKNGIQMYSGTRHGEAASFDEAFAQLVDRYPNKAKILREPGAPAATVAPAPSQKGQTGTTITRAQFDSLPQETRAKFLAEGGGIDGARQAAPSPSGAPAAAPQSSGSSIKRAVFETLSPVARMTHVRGGGSIVD